MSENTRPGSDFYFEVAIPDPSRLQVVHDDELVLAFHHTNPGWETHIVVVPKRHIRSLTTVKPADEPTTRRLLEVVQRIARQVEDETGAAGIRTFTGDYQHSKHLHIHIHSGEALGPNN